jgi:hypothetical protein
VIAMRRGVSCLHASVIYDEYYTACKYEKDWIMEKYEPDNQQVGEAVPTPDGCTCLLRALPLKLFPQRKAERNDSVECSSVQYSSQYKNDIGKCMVLLGIEEMETWATRKRAVLDVLKKMEEFAHATEAGNGESSEPVNNQLRQLVLSKMGNRLNWRGMPSLCRFKKDTTVMQAGATCDISEKAILKSNRSKLRSTMRMLGISELTGHW